MITCSCFAIVSAPMSEWLWCGFSTDEYVEDILNHAARQKACYPGNSLNIIILFHNPHAAKA
jgi:hypothetical protein